MSGWPDPARPGVPLNPEQDSEGHVWRDDSGVDVFRWVAAHQWYEDRKGRWFTPAQAIEDGDTYLGRIVTPAELAAREAAAFKRGAEAMRKDIIEYLSGVEDRCAGLGGTETYKARGAFVRGLVDPHIRALPIPEDKA